MKHEELKTAIKIAIIGMGHLGQLLSGRLCELFGPRQIIFGWISEHWKAAVRQDFPDCVYAGSNIAAIEEADIVLVAVRPGQAETILTPDELAALKTKNNKVVVSFMAAVGFDQLYSLFGTESIIKCAVTVGVELGVGPVVYMTAPGAGDGKLEEAIALLAGLGQLIPADCENSIDQAIVVNGALFALLVDHMRVYTDAAVAVGMFGGNREQVRDTVALTLAAAGQYCLAYPKLSEEEIIDSIATKGGITEAMLKQLHADDVPNLLRRAVNYGLARMEEVIKALRSKRAN